MGQKELAGNKKPVAQNADGWVSKDEAAKTLQVTPRRIEQLIKEGILTEGLRGLIGRKTSRPPGRDLLEVHAGSIERYRAMKHLERSTGSASIAKRLMEMHDAASPRAKESPAPGAPQLQIAAAPGEMEISPSPEGWLTIQEGSIFIRLPESTLLHAIETGELPARNIGVREGGKWRVKRADLLKLGATNTAASGARTRTA